MAQLKIKQISDFVSGVKSEINALVGTASEGAISTAKSEAISTAVSADEVVLSSAKSYADVAESDAISTAVSADEVVLSSAKSYADLAEKDALSAAKDYSDIQKLRIDALLQDSDNTLDTFAEIEKFIKELETADIVGLTTDISNSKSIAISTAVSADVIVLSSAKSYADVAEADAVTEAARLDAIVLSSAKSYADIAEKDAVTAAGDNVTTVITNLNFGDIITANSSDFDIAGSATTAYNNAVSESTRLGDLAYDSIGSASTAEGNAIAAAEDYTDGLINALGTAAYNATEDFDLAGSAENAKDAAKDYTDDEISTLEADLQAQIDGLAGVAFEEVIAAFVDPKSVESGVRFDLNNVKVFVNGLQIHESVAGEGWTSANGTTFVFDLPYAIEADDHVVISGKKA